MRLLHVASRKIKYFLSEDEIEKYAILSHTWGPDEVTFQDWQQLSSEELVRKQGYLKIEYCCKQAVQDGYEWVWVDTCCIDKTSSAELSEAINSMFRWYQRAAICYAHLSDTSSNEGEDQPSPDQEEGVPTLRDKLSESRWITRGWTLQELLAPSNVIFYSHDWKFLGTKTDSVDVLSSITGIDEAYLKGRPLELASAAKKMSWASRRETSRTEDIAYSLLGIFDINMPLLYGEGKKAFRRLQEEIMKAEPEDFTLFAWGRIVPTLASIPTMIMDDKKASETGKILDDPVGTTLPLSGLLASSPRDFKDSGGFMTSPIAGKFYQYGPNGLITSFPQFQGRSIRIQLPVLRGVAHEICYWDRPKMATLRPVQAALLLCCHESEPRHLPAIPLRGWGDQALFGRTREVCLRHSILSTDITPAIFQTRRMIIIAEPRQPIEIQSRDVVLRRHVCGWTNRWSGWWLSTPSVYLDDGVIQLRGLAHGFIFTLFHTMWRAVTTHGFGVRFDRLARDGVSMACLAATLVPVELDGRRARPGEPLYPDFGLRWPTRAQSKSYNPPPQHRQVMDARAGSVVFDILPFPIVKVQVERIPLVEAGGFVDAIDLVVEDREGPMNSLTPRRAP
ncbi:heterokaryon incompatibility protein-domain-containing protein [Xylariomycetidae sp. FL2044]|nr:heterokaryon incompatibility protein-domain-containing protein [Xylariomycetidae sp. FL2044]